MDDENVKFGAVLNDDPWVLWNYLNNTMDRFYWNIDLDVLEFFLENNEEKLINLAEDAMERVGNEVDNMPPVYVEEMQQEMPVQVDFLENQTTWEYMRAYDNEYNDESHQDDNYGGIIIYVGPASEITTKVGQDLGFEFINRVINYVNERKNSLVRQMNRQ